MRGGGRVCHFFASEASELQKLQNLIKLIKQKIKNTVFGSCDTHQPLTTQYLVHVIHTNHSNFCFILSFYPQKMIIAGNVLKTSHTKVSYFFRRFNVKKSRKNREVPLRYASVAPLRSGRSLRSGRYATVVTGLRTLRSLHSLRSAPSASLPPSAPLRSLRYARGTLRFFRDFLTQLNKIGQFY